MAKIRYHPIGIMGACIEVYLEGKYVGDIRQVKTGYQYVVHTNSITEPKGEIFPTIEQVKKSLEEEE